MLFSAGAAPSLISLYFSYGLLLPIPLAAIHTGWIVAVQNEFPESRGAATGLLMTGSTQYYYYYHYYYHYYIIIIIIIIIIYFVIRITIESIYRNTFNHLIST